jgi:LmbE family N-acetylglucosaminyl deacetylase
MKPTFRIASRDLLQAMLERRCVGLSDADLRAPAVVVAPHPDDETLGCGGTIARKRAHGAAVQLVAMTDGGRSHAGLMSRDALSAVRRDELTAAAAALGVGAAQTSWLGFPDGELASFHEQAVVRLTAIFVERQVGQIFVPLPNGEHPDHIAARSIALEAARRSGLALVVFEYPIWFWRRWPWVPADVGGVQARLRAIARALLGLRVLSTFDVSVDVAAVLDSKRRALAAHRSQTTQLIPVAAWFTLGSVADGEFLELFFRGREIFRRSVMPSPRASTTSHA